MLLSLVATTLHSHIADQFSHVLYDYTPIPFKRFILFTLSGMRFCYTLTGMELRHIRYFVAAAEDLNISRAAKRLNVSQPAMSRLIKDLESELGVLLFERERFGLSLTLSGDQMLHYANQILALCQEAKATISTAPTPAKIIKIGFLSPALDLFLAEGLREIHEQNPGVLIKTHEMSPGAQILALRDKKIDVALLGNLHSAQLLDFEHEILFKLTLKVAIPIKHRLAERNIIELKQLATDDFIGYDDQSFPGRNQTIIKACQVAGFEPNLRYKVNSLMEVLAMISSGMGVCLMPEDVALLPHSNVTFVSTQEQLEPILFTIAWRRGEENTMAQKLIETLRKAAANLSY